MKKIAQVGGFAMLTSMMLGCGSDVEGRGPTEPAGPATAASEAEAPSGDDDARYDGPRIPDGAYSRVATTADAERLGVSRALQDKHIGEDGVLPITLRITGDRFTILVDEGDGLMVPGDLGSVAYDEQGRLVTMSRGEGCPGCVLVNEWTLEGRQLTLRFPEDARPEPEERMVVEGTYTRSS